MEAKAKLSAEHVSRLYDLLTLVKPIAGRMKVKGGLQLKDFYQENEWRFVPSAGTLYFEEEFPKERDAANMKIAVNKLDFGLGDIRYIFVDNDREIPELVDFIESKLAHHKPSDLKILITRITSLQTLSLDL